MPINPTVIAPPTAPQRVGFTDADIVIANLPIGFLVPLTHSTIGGGFDGRPVELLVARIRGEDEAHEARGNFGGDGGHRAVGDARSRDRTALSEARTAGQTAAVPAHRHAAHLCLQQWYSLSDPGAEEALYDIQSMDAFAGLDLAATRSPTRRRSSTFAICSNATG